MVDNTAISWTQSDDGKAGATWNPTEGCECCSPGCKNCYAMRMAGRFSAPGKPYHGLVTITSKGKHKGKAVWNGTGRLNKKALRKPLKWRRARRVFVNSMSDLFFRLFTNEEIAAVFGVMAACDRHTFQILTKRGERLPEWYAWVDTKARELATAHRDPLTWDGDPWWRVLVCLIEASKALGLIDSATVDRNGNLIATKDGKPAELLRGAGGATWPLQNVWMGVSLDDRKHGVPRLEALQKIPAVVRFLSCEPLLEDLGTLDLTGIGWLIVGCESGPGSRPFEASWVRNLRDQAKRSGAAFFFKQSSEQIEHVEYTGAGATGGTYPHAAIKAGSGSDRKGRGHGGPIYELPYLDGKQWREFPTSSMPTTAAAA